MTGNKEKQGKPCFDLIPPEAEEALADVLTMGDEKITLCRKCQDVRRA